ncbi:MAG: DUF1425 domain-containing protein [Planctomycetota bacterium]|nr:DUF1425 domain-containing protein [Planctomycetota bacterium]
MRVAIAGMLVVVMAGCVKAPITGRADPYVPPQVNIADADLANSTAFLPPRTERREGLLFVVVPIRSASDYDLHVDYRYTFLNDGGMPIDETGWIGGTTVTRNSYTYIKFNSTSANATEFHLQLRYAQ